MPSSPHSHRESQLSTRARTLTATTPSVGDSRRMPPLLALASALAPILAAALASVTPPVSGDQAAHDGAGSDGAVWPVLPVSVVRPFEAPESLYGAGHRGVDLATEAGQTVTAALPGVVTFAGAVAGRSLVVIRHPGGLRSTLEPLTPVVHQGDRVTQGEPIGVVDTSAHCGWQTCLHWGVRRGTEYLDPTLLVQRRVVLLPLAPSG